MLKAKILFVGPCEVRPGPGVASGAASGGGGAPGAPQEMRTESHCPAGVRRLLHRER